MAIVNVPAPRRANISPVLNFMLQMSSIRERKETRKLQERQLDVDVGALDISRERLPSQIGQAEAAAEQSTALAREADARTDAFIKETDETFNNINTENRRQMAVLKQLGVKEDVLALKRKSARDKAVQNIWDTQSDEIKFNIAHADALGKLATAENRGLVAQNAAANQTNQMLTLQHKIKLDVLNQQMSGLATMESPNDRVAAAKALQDGDRAAFDLAMTGEMAFREAERAKGAEAGLEAKKTTPVTQKKIELELSKDTQYTEATLAELKLAADTGSTPPEVRIIKRPSSVDLRKLGFFDQPFAGFGKGKEFMALTRTDAINKGVVAEWDAAGPSTPTDNRQQPPTSTVRQGVRDAVKKTTPAKETTKQITDSRGWIKFVSPDGVDTWVNPKDVELAKTRGYTLGK